MIFFVETVKTWFSYCIILLTSCYGSVQLSIMQQYLFFIKGHSAEIQGHYVQYSQKQDVYYFMFIMLPQHIGEN